MVILKKALVVYLVFGISVSAFCQQGTLADAVKLMDSLRLHSRPIRGMNPFRQVYSSNYGIYASVKHFGFAEAGRASGKRFNKYIYRLWQRKATRIVTTSARFCDSVYVGCVSFPRYGGYYIYSVKEKLLIHFDFYIPLMSDLKIKDHENLIGINIFDSQLNLLFRGQVWDTSPFEYFTPDHRKEYEGLSDEEKTARFQKDTTRYPLKIAIFRRANTEEFSGSMELYKEFFYAFPIEQVFQSIRSGVKSLPETTKEDKK